LTDENGTSEEQDKQGFASRWSRLKQEAKVDPEAAGVDPDAAGDMEEPVEDDRPDEEVLEELGLPDPDTLEPGDNFSAFMTKAVPARLRNRALRRLWISDPVLANLDELIDYGDDFTDAAAVLENIQTAYQIGKGYVDKVAELPGDEAGDAEEPLEEPAGAVADETGEEPGESGEASSTDDGEAGEDTGQGVPDDAGDDFGAELEGEIVAAAVKQPDLAPKVPVRRRMRFRMMEE
jgi:hypothetical protein